MPRHVARMFGTDIADVALPGYMPECRRVTADVIRAEPPSVAARVAVLEIHLPEDAETASAATGVIVEGPGSALDADCTRSEPPVVPTLVTVAAGSA
jgi:hypothetical protein